MTIDSAFQMLDVYDSYALTEMIEIRKTEAGTYNVPFAPLRSHPSRQVKLHHGPLPGG